MRMKALLLSMLTLVLLSSALIPPALSDCDPWGGSTLRGDIQYPPDWDQYGGILQIRRPFVRFASDGSHLYIKGFEFEVRNAAANGEYGDPNAMTEGLLALVFQYLTPDEGIPAFNLIPYTHIHEKDSAESFAINSASGTADAINSGYVRLVADIPEGPDSVGQFYIPAGARQLAILLVYRGTFGDQTTPALGLGGYWFEPVVQNNTRLAFYRQYGGYSFPDNTNNPSDIYMVLPTGEDVRQITNVDPSPPSVGDASIGYFGTSWSPDGSHLAIDTESCAERLDCSEDQLPLCFDCDLEDYRRDIIILDMSTGHPDPDSPDVFLEFPASNLPDIPSSVDQPAFLMAPSFSPDGTKLTCILKEPNVAGPNALAWFDLPSTGNSIAEGHIVGGFTEGEDSNWYTYWYGNSFREIEGAAPVWSPQENTIAYYLNSYVIDSDSGEIEAKDIHTISLDGTQDVAVTNDSNFNTQQDWSPDGQWFVFVSDRADGSDNDGTMAVWMMDRYGQNKIKIYDDDLDCWCPSFSPDGLRIAFRKGGSICTVDLRGRDYQEVYKLPAGSSDLINEVSWSPYLDHFTKPTVNVELSPAGGVAPGTAVTLSWTVTDADKVVIDNGLGEPSDLTGSVVIYPDEDTIYTVTGYNWAGKAAASATVKVVER